MTDEKPSESSVSFRQQCMMFWNNHALLPKAYEIIAEHCKGAKNNKLLIDTTGAEAEISDVERFQFAEGLQIFARCGIKVALACRPEHIHPRRYAVLLAQKRGVNVEIFTDSQDAEEWLLI